MPTILAMVRRSRARRFILNCVRPQSVTGFVTASQLIQYYGLLAGLYVVVSPLLVMNSQSHQSRIRGFTTLSGAQRADI